jgi:hypothetical protein
MTINELNSKLNIALKNYIKTSKHYSSGKLFNSIKFKCTNNKTTGLQIKLSAMEYINYLDDGDFMTDFFALENVISIITEFLSRDIELNL